MAHQIEVKPRKVCGAFLLLLHVIIASKSDIIVTYLFAIDQTVYFSSKRPTAPLCEPGMASA